MSMPPKQSQPRFISLEGNIGSGKSTVLKIIQENFPELTILDEPLVEWQKIGENKDVNLLQMYYSDTQRWGFTFQIYAFMTRLKKWAEFSKEHGDGFRISERSLLSDRYIFASLMRDMSILSEAEYAVYERCYDSLTKINKVVDLCGLIYIRCPPETCSARILKRSREGEGNIPEEYIQKLHEKHQDWMSRNERVLTIDNSTPLDKNKIIDAVRDWLEGLKSN